MTNAVALIRPTILDRTRPVIIGVLNVTPDSFSDGGKFNRVDAAVEHAVNLQSAGADFIDVGGESTRPGAKRLDPAKEQKRVMPVLRELIALGVPVSIDTLNSSTARAAVDAGVLIVNDVSGGLADPEMYRTIAQTGVHYIASHWRGHSATMDAQAEYPDVVVAVRDALKARIAEMLVWGIQPDKIVLDPGLGFAKTAQHNWAILRALPELESLGYPLMIGASRKRFLAEFTADDTPPKDRDFATAIVSALAAQAGVWGVRVHDVAGTSTAFDIWSEWHSGGAGA